MSIQIAVSCSMCGKHIAEFTADEIDELSPLSIRKRLEDSESCIVQLNEPNFDTYCCAKCAE